MPAPITVLMPTLNAAADMPRALASLGEGLTEGLIRELIVSDGGSTDATLDIADAAGATIVTGPASRGGQLRRGAVRARADWLMVLHADTVLGQGWTRPVAEAIRHGQAGYFTLRFDATGLAPRVVAGWANLRARSFGLPYGDQGLLMPKALYDEVGGYPDIPLMEDVALARALKGRLKPLDVIATTSAERYRRQGWIVRGGRNLSTLTRYLAGADPEALARRYRS
ncbi:TIGR04283 family arsenosugar biosynthesis glycosyltransferase [Sagittula sp. MA-2]|uniref:TIGR04283 family arsenosugar biosynthesis glycosyltransferase n=1 Tax=Sagittula sp. MA-2 TaxID=3048007 RepID=UPI0024C35EB4|nr:TIGR04283 family arsenosugar biosynthesis glycosyltransferase [Sagittula sp. MA-2]WHZ37664.1 TIGR04283 family arsenosugar biosynthesis glycosyltransferase [Sagittula sp. MA-2]